MTDIEQLFAVSKPVAVLDIRQTEKSCAGAAEAWEVIRVPANKGADWQRSVETWPTYAEAEAAIWRGITDWRPAKEMKK